jgi:hypothetical protein
MGVEYRHYLIPENPSFVPTTGVIKRMDAVLEKWKLKAGNPRIYNLSADNHSIVEAPSLGRALVLNILLLIMTGLQLPALWGPSYYNEVADSDRYLAYGFSYRLRKRPAAGA